MGTLLIRADAATEMGTGHVMRCLALAQGWRDHGGEIIFVTATMPAALMSRLTDEGMRHVTIDPEAGSLADAGRTVALALESQADWVVIDGYHFDGAYQQAFVGAGRRVLFVDDYGHAGYYPSGLVLNQNIYATDAMYEQRSPETGLLLGADYALLRREFWSWRGWQRDIKPVAGRILVTMGGSDAPNISLRVMEAMQSSSQAGLEVVVVVGGGNPHFDSLQEAARRSRVPVRLLRNASSMPELMAWADVAISAAGSTCWELSFMGLPALLVVLAENQAPIGAGLGEVGVAVNLGWHSQVMGAALREQLDLLLGAPERRALMAERGQRLVDGRGVERVLAAMLADGAINLRRAAREDAELFWRWANEPGTRAASFSTEPIPWEAHLLWYESKLSDTTCILFVAMTPDGQPIGQVRFDIDETDATISVSLDPAYRSQGYGSRLIALATDRVFDNRALAKIHAYIRPENQASRKAFSRAGYQKSENVIVRGMAAHHYVRTREWHVEHVN